MSTPSSSPRGATPTHDGIGCRYIVFSFGPGKCKFLMGLPVQSLETGIEAKQNSAQNLDFPNLISIIQCCYLGTTLDFFGPIKIALVFRWIFLVLSNWRSTVLYFGEIRISLQTGAHFVKSRNKNRFWQIEPGRQFCTRKNLFVPGSYYSPLRFRFLFQETVLKRTGGVNRYHTKLHCGQLDR